MKSLFPIDIYTINKTAETDTSPEIQKPHLQIQVLYFAELSSTSNFTPHPVYPSASAPIRSTCSASSGVHPEEHVLDTVVAVDREQLREAFHVEVFPPLYLLRSSAAVFGDDPIPPLLDDPVPRDRLPAERAPLLVHLPNPVALAHGGLLLRVALLGISGVRGGGLGGQRRTGCGGKPGLAGKQLVLHDVGAVVDSGLGILGGRVPVLKVFVVIIVTC